MRAVTETQMIQITTFVLSNTARKDQATGKLSVGKSKEILLCKQMLSELRSIIQLYRLNIISIVLLAIDCDRVALQTSGCTKYKSLMSNPVAGVTRIKSLRWHEEENLRGTRQKNVILRSMYLN